MISVEMTVVMRTTMLEVLSDLKHLGSWRNPKVRESRWLSLYRSTESDD